MTEKKINTDSVKDLLKTIQKVIDNKAFSPLLNNMAASEYLDTLLSHFDISIRYKGKSK